MTGLAQPCFFFLLILFKLLNGARMSTWLFVAKLYIMCDFRFSLNYIYLTTCSSTLYVMLVFLLESLILQWNSYFIKCI